MHQKPHMSHKEQIFKAYKTTNVTTFDAVILRDVINGGF